MYYFTTMTEKFGERTCGLTGVVLEDGDNIVIKVDDYSDAGRYRIDPDSAEINENTEFFYEDSFYDEYAQCEDCGEWYLREDMYWVHPGGYEGYVCDSCLDEYAQCEDCEEYFRIDDMYHTVDDTWVCGRCRDRYDYCHCDRCEEYSSSGTYDEDNDEWFCDRCWEEIDRHRPVHQYGYKPDPVFHHENEDRKLYMGVELEVDDGYDDGFLYNYVDKDDIYCKHDGSLSDDGVEIVSHPRTLASHKNYKWNEICTLARNSGYSSHNAETCGLHIHVNRDFFVDRDLATAKLIIIMSKFWDDFIIPFSRRMSSQLRWCCKPSDTVVVEKGDTVETIHEKLHKARSDGRYKALNLCNQYTLEFRVFRGTIKYSSFMATLEFVDGICHYVNETSLEELMDATAQDIFLSKYFDNTTYYKDYLVARNIFTKEEIEGTATAVSENNEEVR